MSTTPPCKYRVDFFFHLLISSLHANNCNGESGDYFITEIVEIIFASQIKERRTTETSFPIYENESSVYRQVVAIKEAQNNQITLLLFRCDDCAIECASCVGRQVLILKRFETRFNRNKCFLL